MNKKYSVGMIVLLLTSFICISTFAKTVQVINLSDIDTVTLKSYGNLFITQGDKNTLWVETVKANLHNIKVINKNRQLVIKSIDQSSSWLDSINLFKSPYELNFYLIVKNLEFIDLDGSGNITIDREMKLNKLNIDLNGSGDFNAIIIKTDNFSININGSGALNINSILSDNFSKFKVAGSGDLNIASISDAKINIVISGSGNVNLKKVKTEDIDSEIIGSGKINVAGIADTQKVSIIGSGNYYGKSLKSNKSDLYSTGGGNITVSSENFVSVNKLGSGDMNIYGKPKINSFNVEGSGSVHFHNLK